MSQVNYTTEAWVALTQNPEDRSEVFSRLTETMGGRLLSLYYTFGEYDVLVIYEAPRREYRRSHRACCHLPRASH